MRRNKETQKKKRMDWRIRLDWIKIANQEIITGLLIRNAYLLKPWFFNIQKSQLSNIYTMFTLISVQSAFLCLMWVPQTNGGRRVSPSLKVRSPWKKTMRYLASIFLYRQLLLRKRTKVMLIRILSMLYPAKTKERTSCADSPHQWIAPMIISSWVFQINQ